MIRLQGVYPIQISIVIVMLLILFIGTPVGQAQGLFPDTIETYEPIDDLNPLLPAIMGAEEDDERFALVDDDPYIGFAGAPIVIVEFSDFSCSYCGRHHRQTVEPLLEEYGQYIRYVYRDFAMLTDESENAAVAANCANEQDNFWSYHDELFYNQRKHRRAFYVELAQELGMDVIAFVTCYDTRRYQDEVQSDRAEGRTLGISGTPTFFINGARIVGAQPFETFETVILSQLEAMGIHVNDN